MSLTDPLDLDVLPWMIRWSEMNGLVNLFGMTFARDADRIVTHLLVTESMAGSTGIAHGGVALSLLDTGMGVAALEYSLPRQCAASTIELKSNLLRPIPVGTSLVCRARRVHEGRTHVVVTGELQDVESDEVFAMAMGTFNLYPSEAVTRMFESS